MLPSSSAEDRAGALAALNEFVPRIYDELRAVARRFLARERADHPFQTTVLVHEAYLRVARADVRFAASRTQCLASASLAMRRILVEEARAAAALKRGGDHRRICMEALSPAICPASTEFLALHEAMEQLEAYDERKARVVEMRFFGGMSCEEVAEVLELTPRTVERDWQFARAWLYRELTRGAERSE